MSIIMLAAFLALILAIAARKLWLNGHYHGLTKGMVIGYDHGDRDGYAEGYTLGQVDYALAHPAGTEPSEAEYYAAVVSSIPDAQDLADAHRLGAVRRSVQGQEGLS